MATAKAKRKARTVSSDKLAAAIDEAIAGAAERRNVGARRSTLTGLGRITGRLILEPDMNKALEFAQAVSSHVSKLTGVAATPAVARVSRGVLAGFFERGKDIGKLGR